MSYSDGECEFEAEELGEEEIAYRNIGKRIVSSNASSVGNFNFNDYQKTASAASLSKGRTVDPTRNNLSYDIDPFANDDQTPFGKPFPSKARNVYPIEDNVSYDSDPFEIIDRAPSGNPLRTKGRNIVSTKNSISQDIDTLQVDDLTPSGKQSSSLVQGRSVDPFRDSNSKDIDPLGDSSLRPLIRLRKNKKTAPAASLSKGRKVDSTMDNLS